MGGRFSLVALTAANAVSLVGNVIATVAVPWFVLETTGSAAKTGIAAFFTTLPLAFGALFGGTIADRVGHRVASITTDVISASAIAAVPILHELGRLQFWQLVALVFVTSLFDGPGQSAREALVPRLAEDSGRSLERATSMWVSTEHVAYVVGAPLAGVLIAAVGAAHVMLIDAASFVAAAAVVGLFVRAVHVTPNDRSRYVDQLRDGIRFLVADPVLRLFLVAAAVGNMLAAPIALVFLPVYAKEVLGSAEALGFCIAAYGVGGIAGAILLQPIVRMVGRRRAYVLSWLVWVAVYFAIAALPPLPIMLLVLLATALSVAAPIEALVRQERTPADLRARVFATFMAALTLTSPVGVLAAGFLVEYLGLQAAILGAAALNAVAALVFVGRAARSVQAATSAR